jgi:hypothetical protein
MAFVSILRTADNDQLQIVASEERTRPEQQPTAEGVFVEVPDPVVFQREVPDPQALLNRLAELLASSKVEGSQDTFVCPVPVAIRAIEVATAALWPTRRLQCPDCHQHFVIPYPDRRQLYLACPHCHNPLLNPSWDSA